MGWGQGTDERETVRDRDWREGGLATATSARERSVTVTAEGERVEG